MGTRRDPLGISAWRSIAHRIYLYESGPRSFGVGSKIGYHHHQLRRSAFIPNPRQIPPDSQGAVHK